MEEFNHGLLQPKKQQISHFIHHWSCGELAKARFTIHFVFVDLLLFSFFADWLLNICDASSKTSKEDYDSVEGKVYSEEQMNHTSCKNAASQS